MWMQTRTFLRVLRAVIERLSPNSKNSWTPPVACHRSHLSFSSGRGRLQGAVLSCACVINHVGRTVAAVGSNIFSLLTSFLFLESLRASSDTLPMEMRHAEAGFEFLGANKNAVTIFQANC